MTCDICNKESCICNPIISNDSISFKKPIPVGSDSKKCPYCKLKFPASTLNDHIGYEHAKQLRATVKRLKIALPIMIVGISIVIGMLWMEIIR